MVQFRDWREEDLTSIKAPSLLILADRDVMTPEHAVEIMHKIPDSKLMILPGSHGTYIGEGLPGKENSKIPALTVAVVEEFLDK